MKDQINTIRAALAFLDARFGWSPGEAPAIDTLRAALSDLESSLAQYEAGDVASAAAQGFRDGVASVTQQEPVAWAMPKGDGTFIDVITPAEHAREEGSYTVPLFAHPVAQQPQYEAGDMASAAAQGFRDGVASVAQQPPKLEDIEQYRMQMAGISTAAMGYWKEGDSIHPDYDTLALRDVAKLYAKYDALYKAQQPQTAPQFPTMLRKMWSGSEVQQWINENWPAAPQQAEKPLAALEPASSCVQHVPDHCDRIVWRNRYYHLPLKQPQAEPDFTHSKTAPTEIWKNRLNSLAERLEMADGAVAFEREVVANLRERLKQPQAEAVPLTHVLVPVDEPTDEMVDAACAAVDGLCRVDFVRAYVAAFAHLKAGYRDESYWCGWNAAIKFQQAEAVPPDVVRDAAPIPDHELVTMYDERPTSDLEMIEFAREVERRHGIGVQPQHITDGSPCWCNPDVAYADPETGASVIVHRRPQ